MADKGKKKQPPKEADAKAKKPPPQPIDEDYEDGDIATPKRDRDGPDDEPL